MYAVRRSGGGGIPTPCARKVSLGGGDVAWERGASFLNPIL